MVDRVGNTCVLCYALVSEVDLSIFIKCYILKKSVSLDRIVDVRLRLFVKVDNLSVASTLEVEYSVVIPAVLVITDQKTLRICGKCCFTCSGKTEEDCCVLSVKVCICRAVHGSNALKRQIVVHHGEHTFLHLSAVPCIYDNLLTACNVEHYSCLRVKTQLFVVLNFSLGCVVNNEIWLKVLKFLSCWLNEHVCYEVCLPSNLNDETDSHTCIFVSSAECIYYEKSLVGKLFLSKIFNCSPCFLSCRMVIVFVLIGCPPNCVFGVLIHNDIFVFRGTSCVDTCHYIDSTKLADPTNLKALKLWFGLFLE